MRLRTHVPSLIVLTLMSGLIYVGLQQIYRQSANDPQIQLAEDAAAKLSAGAVPESVLPNDTVDIAQGLAPYIVVFNDQGQPIASSGQLNGKMPTLPAGIFDFTRTHKQDRFTWQPEKDVRSAAIVQRFEGSGTGFVLAGRSLREVEKRENSLTTAAGIVWLFGVLAISIWKSKGSN